MKIKINGFEVEFKAKRTFDSRCSEKQTENFANWLSIIMSDMSDYYQRKANDTDDTELKENRERMRDYFEEYSNDIYTALKAKGYYNR